MAESFFHLLKTELTYHCHWLTYQAAHRSLFEYIEIFYNRERTHSTLDYPRPIRAAAVIHNRRLRVSTFFGEYQKRSCLSSRQHHRPIAWPWYEIDVRATSWDEWS